MILRLAARNLLRKRQRTIITTAALALAGALMLYFSCLLEGFQGNLVSNLIGLETGHLQAHARQWRSDQDLRALIQDPDTALAAMEQAGALASARLYAWGLAALEENTAVVELRGLEIEREQKVTRLHEKLAEGTFLEPGDLQGVVLGKELAHRLGAHPGSKVVLLVQAADGSLADFLFTVRGILKNVSAKADDAGFFIGASIFRELLVLPRGCHEIALRLPGRPAQAVLERLAKDLQQRLPALEVLDWRRLKPMAAQVLNVQRIAFLILMVIAYSAAGLVIFNAMLMNVFERLREFGILKAIGAPSSFILKLVYTETALESLLAAGLALAMAVPLALRTQTKGLDLSGLSSGSRLGGMLLEPVLYAHVSWTALWPPLLFLFALSSLAVAYPAGKAALLKPLAAIHYR